VYQLVLPPIHAGREGEAFRGYVVPSLFVSLTGDRSQRSIALLQPPSSGTPSKSAAGGKEEKVVSRVTRYPFERDHFTSMEEIA
jgi:hypothetical protein